MKKIMILIVLTTVLLYSCAERKTLLHYQSDIDSVILKTSAPSYATLLLRPAERTITVLAPSRLAGITFTLGDNTAISAGDMRVPLSSEQSFVISLWLHAFTLTEEELTSVKSSDGELTKVSFYSEMGEFNILYSKDGLPTALEITSGSLKLSAKVEKIDLKS